MTDSTPMTCTAFEGFNTLASGEVATVAQKAKEFLDSHPHASILIFNDTTSEQMELDFRGTMDEVLQRLENNPETSRAADPMEMQSQRGPGRPKLGVVAREITLLPRHWDWLNGQPGGASVALRKLVDQARHILAGADQLRQAQEACYRFMSAMAGNLPHFEDATRALFSRDQARFNMLVEAWPGGVRDHVKKLAVNAFQKKGEGRRID